MVLQSTAHVKNGSYGHCHFLRMYDLLNKFFVCISKKNVYFCKIAKTRADWAKWWSFLNSKCPNHPKTVVVYFPANRKIRWKKILRCRIEKIFHWNYEGIQIMTLHSKLKRIIQKWKLIRTNKLYLKT